MNDNIISAVPEETALTFNYAVLSAEMGDYLRAKEQQLKNEYMNFTANCGAIFAEAQERLAKNGFGENNGLFRKWIDSMGFSKSAVYRMIDIHKFRLSQIGTDEGQAFFDALPKTLQADISAPSAPPELVEQVMSGDITTHKEYIELKKQLESTQKELTHTKDDLRNVERNFDEREKLRLKMGEENTELRLKIKELENRPIEVAVAESGSVADAERKFNETLRNLNRRITDITEESEREIFDMRTERNAALDRAEAAEAELERMRNSKVKSFCIKMTVEDYDVLLSAVRGTAVEYAVKNAQIIRI